MRRGLVLEGGGAKGAYQFGCLKAFASRGLHFDAIAGTSVGALNGYLLASSSLAEGNAIWRTVSQERVYPWRFHRWLAYCLSPLLVLSHALTILARGHMVLPPWTVFLLSCVYPAPVAFLFFVSDMKALWLLGCMFFPYTLWGAWCASRDGTFELYRRLWLIVYFTMGFVILLLFVMTPIVEGVARLPGIRSFPRIVAWLTENPLEEIVTPFGLPRGELMLMFVTGCALIGMVVLLRALAARLTLMKSSGLNRTLANLVAKKPLLTPLYVTVGAEVRVFDPDEPTYEELDNYEKRTYAPSRYLPRYLPLHRFDPIEQSKALLASAALPFGVVPSITIKGETCVDGGIIDNCPSYPLVEFEKCDELVVISTSTRQPRWSHSSRWQSLERLVRLEGAFRDYSRKVSSREDVPFKGTNLPPRHIPFLDESNWQASVSTLRPSRSLGGFFFGTLNFNAAYATKIMQRGYEDALLWLDRRSQERSR